VLTRESVEAAVNDWYAPERIESELDAERTTVFVAEQDGTVVGFAHATWNEEEATGYVLRLYVDPDHRRERIGHALLEETCRELTARGVDRIDAMVLSARRPTRRAGTCSNPTSRTVDGSESGGHADSRRRPDRRGCRGGTGRERPRRTGLGFRSRRSAPAARGGGGTVLQRSSLP
jgi:GNAT superfamily N-acetyltransferase